MSVVEAVARVTQLQSELAALRAPVAGATSAGADAFAALLGSVQTGGAPAAQPAGVTGQQIVQDAEQYLGVPYVFGGESTSGMDCSGLVQKVLGDLGISAPRVVQDQAKIGTPVASLADAQPGDLIVEKGNGHIQIYAGDGMIIEAPRLGENVVKRKEWLSPDQIGTIRRVAQPTQSAQSAQSAQTDAQLSALIAPLLQAQPALPQPADAGGDPAHAPVTPVLEAGAVLAQALLPQSTDAAAATPSPAPASAPIPTPALTGQLSGPITQLVTQPDGSHTVVVRVVPEQLGPVTVDAHLTDHGLRIELTAPTDAGRDALAGVLGELRRDLAAGGITASVSLGSADTGSGAGDGRAGAQQAVFELLEESRSGMPLPRPAAQPRLPSAAPSADSVLDVLA